MKHRKYIALLSAFLVGLILASFSLSGCSGFKNLNSISAYSLFSHECLTLPIKVKKGDQAYLKSSGFISFESSKDLNDLYETLSKNTDLNVVKYDSSILIKQAEGSYTNHYCIRKGKNDRYIFSGMRGRLITDIDSNGNKIKSAILLPVHIINDPLIIENSELYAFYVDVEYEICGDMADIEQFYTESGWYEMTCEEDELIIYGYKNQQDVFIDSTASPEYYEGTLEITQPYHIRVNSHDDKTFFSVSLG